MNRVKVIALFKVPVLSNQARMNNHDHEILTELFNKKQIMSNIIGLKQLTSV